jgi:DNA-binding transcriptional LysR family regulator
LKQDSTSKYLPGAHIEVMTLHQLRIFASVARHSSMTRAAKELHMSQPAVSHQLKLLEEEFESSFHFSSKSGVQLTPEGQAFLVKTAPILAQAEDVEKSFKPGEKRPKSDRLIVGANHTLSGTLLTESLMAFKKTHPWVTCQLETSDSRTMERRVLNGEVAIAVITHPSHSPQLALEPFRQHEMTAFVPAGSPLSAHVVKLADVAKLPLVVRSGGSTVKELQRRGYRLNIAAQCEASEMVKAAVKRGLGVGLLNRDSIERELTDGDLKEVRVLGLEEIKVQSFIIYGKRRPLGAVARDFRQLLLEKRDRKIARKRKASGSAGRASLHKQIE